jgi:hypothetical protein
MRWRNALVLGVAATLLSSTAAQAANELSTSDRLQDRREIASGTRAYAVGFEDGRFYANGWHITGEMGGVWTPPLKLLDGLWFGVGDEWVGRATRFMSGRGYVRYDLPDLGGLQLRRTDFVPDDRRAALFGLELTNPAGTARTVTVKVDARSELMTSYPWGWSTGGPTAGDNLPDTGSFDGNALVFRDHGTLPGAEPHDYAALVASTLEPDSGTTGSGFWGAQPGTTCAASSQSMPSGCDDGPFGRGTGGELRYTVTVPAGGSQTVWVAAAGSDQGLQAAQDELASALRDPAGQLAEKTAARDDLASRSRVTLPGDPQLQEAIDWGKQNLADLTQTAENLKIRFTNQGKAYPAPKGTIARATWVGAGFPDYPWMFATDGEYTAFASVALGQFEAIEDHLRALRDASDILNDGSGKVAHEIMQDGSVYFGANADPGNTDETVKFPSTVALVWRWTGDDRFRDDLYDFAKRNLRYVATNLDADKDGWPEGLGNVEQPGMGPEKLDNGVYYIRGLFDLADMARSKHDRATERWAGDLARDLRARFDSTWWHAPSTQFADSLGDADRQLQQKHWIGVAPMDAELTVDGNAVPGLAPRDHGIAALAERETNCYSGVRPLNRGLFHTGCGGGADGKGTPTIFSLGNAVQAVGEGNYGRLGPDQQRRYTDANVETMLAEPATGGQPDEQPGALPEILPSPGFGDRADNDKNIDRCWTCRAMFMQAWGVYGLAWPVIHQQLGVRPSLGDDRLAVVPQVPDGQPNVKGEDIRLGDGAASVFAARAGKRYTTRVALEDLRVRLTLGATLPAGARVAAVYRDGRRVKRYDAQQTNRGLEVTVAGGRSLTILTR